MIELQQLALTEVPRNMSCWVWVTVNPLLLSSGLVRYLFHLLGTDMFAFLFDL